MTKLNSSELRALIEGAGIKYKPAPKIFYPKEGGLPYKVELRPKHRGKGLGGVSGKRSCQIDITNPIKAREELAAFNDRMDKIISNVEYRREICNFVKRLPQVEYKTRMGGDNNLFYFRDPELVMVLVNRYHDVINSVTGPINDTHEERIGERNVQMRKTLYFNKYRYYLEFERSDEFVTRTAPRLLEALNHIESGNWREHKLTSIIKFYEAHGSIRGNRSATATIIGGQPNVAPAAFNMPYSFPPRAVALYLVDPEDYVYLKLLAAEHIKSNHELVLFDELT